MDGLKEVETPDFPPSGKIFLSNLACVGVYYETELERISVLMFFTSQELINEQFNTFVRHIVFPTKKFVFRVIGNLYLSVISSDPSDTTVILDLVLNHYYNLLRFRCNIEPSGSKWSASIERTKRRMRPLLKTLLNLVENHQPILFNGLSSIDLDRFETRSKIVDILSKNLDDSEHACHGVIFSGTRLIAVWSRKGIQWVLKPKDLNCLMIYGLSLEEGEKHESVFFYSSPRDVEFQTEEALYSLRFKYDGGGVDSNFVILVALDYDAKKEFFEDTRTRCKRIRHDLNLYLPFLSVKVNHKLTMRHFFRSTPGVLHFFFVDRLRGKVTAPDIVSLGVLSAEYIKRMVFDMVNVVSSYRSEGYHQVVLFKREVTYCFQEWIVTKDNRIMEIKVQSMKSSNSQGHFELYTIYLPFVSLQGIESFNNAIMKQYCKGSV